MLFPTAPSPTPYGLPFPKIGVRTPPKLQSLSSQKRVKLRISNLASTFTGSIRTKPMKNFGEKRAWAYPGTAHFFRVPPIISGMGKATNFKLCMHIYRLNRNKRPLKIFGKVAMVRDSLNFFRAPIHRAHRAVIFAIAQLSCITVRCT